MQLKEKVVAITGGSKGFGRALAEAFIKEGANVAICAVNEAELNRTVDETGAYGVVADVRKEEDMQKFLDKVIERFGTLDIWVNNAGVWMPHLYVEEFDMNKVKDTIDVNVIGLINGSRAALRFMKKAKSGTIVNIISTSGLVARAKSSMYAASKWAATGFTKSLREENKDGPIKVLAVYPGGMKTTIFGDYKYPDFDKFMEPKDVAEKVINNLRQDKPEEDLIIKRQNT